jgi:hypothetical protein
VRCTGCDATVEEGYSSCPSCGLVLVDTPSPDGPKLRSMRDGIMANPNFAQQFLDHAEQADELTRQICLVLEERKSVLILRQGDLEIEEAMISGEIYSANAFLLKARTKEKVAILTCEKVQGAAYINLARANKDAKVTDIRMHLLVDPELIEAKKLVLDAEEERKLAEAYLSALDTKARMLSGAQGHRNKEYDRR